MSHLQVRLEAYDHVNWEFLFDLLKALGFGNKRIEWIQVRISTIRLSVIINGTPEGFFRAYRGLRQWNPVYPFHFILVMESLSSMLKVAEQRWWIQGFSADNRCQTDNFITHITYADDTLVLCEAERAQFLRLILLIF